MQRTVWWSPMALSTPISMSPWQQYAFDCQQRGYISEASQGLIMRELDRLYDDLADEGDARAHWWSRLCRRKPRAGRGVYLWGSVGTGKSYCMDVFYRCVPGIRKWRIHFHAFMQYIQQQLQVHKGQRDPLQRVVADMALHYDLLCLDEFLVTDITDAVILHAVLLALQQQGITLVATSNTAPSKLYLHGLQRARFLPAIAFIQQHMAVLPCNHQQDFRHRSKVALPVYFSPLNTEASQHMLSTFYDLVPDGGVRAKPLHIAGRSIMTIRGAERVVWFDFMAICASPRCTADYLVLAQRYDVVFISDIPSLTTEHPSLVVNWMHLVDVFYDAKLKLVVSAQCRPARLYMAGAYLDAYARTQSRLFEMSHEQWASQWRGLAAS